ncbi:cation diffusion facilitator family transporter [Bacillus solimangrovi]|uniref:Cation transporter n=1 Tax=Bacillus solimangrovi TaxID=1305675 RepID=A0A1E5LBS2_9BACI|nr:cation diffusion facilitator family transporter [Bacillus solimangrovi]OEH91544.1 cation transporter [Bacillus solimangrovi]
MHKEERFKKAEFAAMVGIIGNIVLAIIKVILGTIGNSRALIADAAHSFSDVVGSLAVFIGLRAAKQPPDEDHPYGHGKAESIAAIIVAVLLFVVGIEIALTSYKSFFKDIVAPSMAAVYGVLLSIFIKEAMFQYKFRLGKKIKSDAIIVNAYEHRSDVYSSLAALVGIVAAMVGGRVGIDWLVYADPVAGIFVAGLVIRMAWKLGAESIHNTLDHVLHEEEEIKRLRDVVNGVDGVREINELLAREHGHYVIVDIKIAVDPFITVEEGHYIGKCVKEQLLNEPNVQDVMVHINPYNLEKEST